jgi:hypothetical protein
MAVLRGLTIRMAIDRRTISAALGAAWRSKPSFYAVSTEDRTINPDLERFMAKRMGAKTIEVKASHVSPISHPDEISALILKAAQRAWRRQSMSNRLGGCIGRSAGSRYSHSQLFEFVGDRCHLFRLDGRILPDFAREPGSDVLQSLIRQPHVNPSDAAVSVLVLTGDAPFDAVRLSPLPQPATATVC